MSAGTALLAPRLCCGHAVCAAWAPGRVPSAWSCGQLWVTAPLSTPTGNRPHHDPSATGNKFSPCHAAVLLLCVWAYALVFATAPLAEWGSYGPEPYGTACCISWETSSREATLYILALFIFCYLLPCLLILASYSLILWTVRVSGRAVRQHGSPRRAARSVHGLVVKVGGPGARVPPAPATAPRAGDAAGLASGVFAAPKECSRCLYLCG